jgi:hypothetical protein
MNSGTANAAAAAFFLWLAEVGASFTCWNGLPFDTSPEPHFDFWYLESWRLLYWAVCFSCAFTVWLALCWLMRRLATPRRNSVKDSFRAITVRLSAVSLAIGAELATSGWYQRRLPFGLSFGMSAWDLRLYMRQHFIAWAAISIILLTAWHATQYLARKHSQRPHDPSKVEA